MYSLYCPTIENAIYNSKKIEKAVILFREVLGYTQEECDEFVRIGFGITIAKHLTKEQIYLIVKPFIDANIKLMLFQKWDEIDYPFDIPEKEEFKKHYYDKPIILENQKENPFNSLWKTPITKDSIVNTTYNNESKQSKKVIACPYCQSTNTEKLDVIDRGVSFGLFGFASSKVGKQWHCNSCKSDF